MIRSGSQCTVLVIAAIACALAGVALAQQRVQFPSPVQSAPGYQQQPLGVGTQAMPVASPYATAAPSANVTPYASSYAAQPNAVTPITPGWDPYSSGAATTPPPSAVPYSTPQPSLGGTYTPPTYGAPATPAYGAPAAPTYGAPGYGNPGYAPPMNPQHPGALFPSGLPFGYQRGTYVYQGGNGTVVPFQRFLQNVGFEYTWLAGFDDSPEKKFEWNRVEFWSTFGVPIFYNTETPLRVTPGFAINYLEGPVTLPTRPTDLPPRIYDAYLDGAWEPRLTEWFSGDLGFRVGVYSDFDHVTNDSVRFMGRGLGVLQFTPTMRVAAGVWYLDRNRTKLLPAGGLIWTPSPDTNFRIVFPNPKLAHRFTTVGTADWWWYFTGEYGGGAWTVQRVGGTDNIDYNDVRIAFGLEWIGQRGMRGHIEVGYVWDREVLFVRSNTPPSFKPDDTLMLRGGIDY